MVLCVIGAVSAHVKEAFSATVRPAACGGALASRAALDEQHKGIPYLGFIIGFAICAREVGRACAVYPGCVKACYNEQGRRARALDNWFAASSVAPSQLDGFFTPNDDRAGQPSDNNDKNCYTFYLFARKLALLVLALPALRCRSQSCPRRCHAAEPPPAHSSSAAQHGHVLAQVVRRTMFRTRGEAQTLKSWGIPARNPAWEISLLTHTFQCTRPWRSRQKCRCLRTFAKGNKNSFCALIGALFAPAGAQWHKRRRRGTKDGDGRRRQTAIARP